MTQPISPVPSPFAGAPAISGAPSASAAPTAAAGTHTGAAAQKDPRSAKLHHAAHEFESMLVKQLLKAAKMGGTGTDKSSGYADMAVDALANGIEKGGGLGLARRIEDALHGGAHGSVASAAGAAAKGPSR